MSPGPQKLHSSDSVILENTLSRTTSNQKCAKVLQSGAQRPPKSILGPILAPTWDAPTSKNIKNTMVFHCFYCVTFLLLGPLLGALCHLLAPFPANIGQLSAQRESKWTGASHGNRSWAPQDPHFGHLWLFRCPRYQKVLKIVPQSFQNTPPEHKSLPHFTDFLAGPAECAQRLE